MTCIKKMTIIAIIFLVFISTSLFADSKSLNNAIKSVVMIYSVNSSNQNSKNIFLSTDNNFSLGGQNLSIGSGVIVDSNYIITNYHVVKTNNTIKIVLYNGLSFEAFIVYSDPKLDLSLLRVDELASKKIKNITFKSYSELSLGDKALAVGNPFGIGISVTQGIVSALPSSNHIFDLNIGDLIQTDAVLNPGNSGGALLDDNGNLIGMNTAIFAPKGASTGIGFAIPADVLKLFIERSLKGEKMRKYWLGFSASSINSNLAKKNGLSSTSGIVVNQIYDKSPASKAGLKNQDIILKINDLDVNTVSKLNLMIAELDNNAPVKILLYRGGKYYTVDLIPEIPADMNQDYTLIASGNISGLEVANNTPLVAHDLNLSYLKEGVIVYAVKKNSLAEKYGLKSRDVLLSINHNRIMNVKELVFFLRKNNSSTFNIVFLRNNNPIEISIQK